MKDVKTIIGSVLCLAAMAAFMYGMYWIAKTVSYQIFYEDMVIDTIK